MPPEPSQTRLRRVFLVQDAMGVNDTLHVDREGPSLMGHGGTMRDLHQQNASAVNSLT